MWRLSFLFLFACIVGFIFRMTHCSRRLASDRGIYLANIRLWTRPRILHRCDRDPFFERSDRCERPDSQLLDSRCQFRLLSSTADYYYQYRRRSHSPHLLLLLLAWDLVDSVLLVSVCRCCSLPMRHYSSCCCYLRYLLLVLVVRLFSGLGRLDRRLT